MYSESQRLFIRDVYWEREQALAEIHRALNNEDGKGDNDFSRVWDSAPTLGKVMVLVGAYKLCTKHFPQGLGFLPTSGGNDVDSCRADILTDLIKQGAKQLSEMAGHFEALEKAREGFEESKEAVA